MENKLFLKKKEKVNHILSLPKIPSKRNNIKSKKIQINENTVSFNSL
jgi:hypothetical protein